MDLNHAVPFTRPARVLAGTYEDCKDAIITVVTAGSAQKPGETRLDLVKRNTEIFKSIIPEIVNKQSQRDIIDRLQSGGYSDLRGFENFRTA